MGYTSPAAVVSGAVISKTTFGDVVKADLDFLANPPACRVYHNVGQSINNVSLTALAFNSERFDTDTMHDTVTNNSRVTFKTAGLYVVTGGIYWASNATGIRAGMIVVNGGARISEVQQQAATGSEATRLALAAIYKFAVNDYIQLMAYQNSGGALSVDSSAAASPELAAAWIGLG